jgi:amidase
LLDAYLDRIEQVNPAINAVVTIDAEAARATATAADEQIARGQELGALPGLPMADCCPSVAPASGNAKRQVA